MKMLPLERRLRNPSFLTIASLKDGVNITCCDVYVAQACWQRRHCTLTVFRTAEGYCLTVASQ